MAKYLKFKNINKSFVMDGTLSNNEIAIADVPLDQGERNITIHIIGTADVYATIADPTPLKNTVVNDVITDVINSSDWELWSPINNYGTANKATAIKIVAGASGCSVRAIL